MAIKAVLFDFNGVIVNDEPLHEQLINQLLLEENLRPKGGEFKQFCLGRSDRACIHDLLTHRGRFVTEKYLDELIKRKSKAYQERLTALEKLPSYVGLEDFIYKLRVANLAIAMVSGALRAEIDLVLSRLNLSDYFSVIVAGDDLTKSKPEPDGYLLAIERLNQKFPALNLLAKECVAIEDTPAGIRAAKQAGIPVVGVANTYPFHMLQRQANWTVDYLLDVELDRLQAVYA